MKVGLLSDTHGFLDSQIFEYFKEVDEVWHAGDLGDHVLERLDSFKPTKAVYGNIDSRALQHQLPEDLWIEPEGVVTWITHIGGTPPLYNSRVKKIFEDRTPQLFICGHSHMLKVTKDLTKKNMLFINPGAAGHHGFHHMRTVMTLEFNGGTIENVEVMELGKRGRIAS